jgi:hypothetical protein
MIKSFKRVPTADKDISKLQDSVIEVVNNLARLDLLSYVILENLIVGTTTVTVAHNLSRRPTGFFVIKSNADVRVWEDTTVTLSAPLLLIALKANVSATVNVLIF